jgi:hypothetical protein
MRIIKATDAIPVEHPVFMIFGQPGIGKSSLGFSAKRPLLLDFDKGAHRAANRRDSLVIDTWKDVVELMESTDALEPYDTIVVDTAGRCLDVMTAYIAATDPKKAPGGSLSLQGWGVLKANFRTWTAQLRTKGKDLLLIAHDREDKDGDRRIVRPEIVGASYGEVMKIADFVGYAYMAGRLRVLDFNPTDSWIAKNPAQWKPFEIPPVSKAQDFMATLFDMGRDALGTISEASAKIAQAVEEWRTAIDAYTKPDEFTKALTEINALEPVAMAQVKKVMADRAKALEFHFDTKAKAFVAPVAASA